MHLFKTTKASGIIEYCFLTGLLAVGIIGSVLATSQSTISLFDSVSIPINQVQTIGSVPDVGMPDSVSFSFAPVNHPTMTGYNGVAVPPASPSYGTVITQDGITLLSHLGQLPLDTVVNLGGRGPRPQTLTASFTFEGNIVDDLVSRTLACSNGFTFAGDAIQTTISYEDPTDSTTISYTYISPTEASFFDSSTHTCTLE